MEEDISVGKKMALKLQEERAKFLQKQKEENKKKIQMEMSQMAIEQSTVDSFQKQIRLREFKEKKQRALGIGCHVVSYLYLGSIESSNNLAWLELENIHTIINCTSECFNDEYESIEYFRFPLLSSKPSIKNHIQGIIQTIDNARICGYNVLIHSDKGKSRAPAALIAYLMSKEKQGFIETTDMVKKNSWELNISFSLVNELSEFAKQQGFGKTQSTQQMIYYDPIIRQVMGDAEFETMDRKKKWDFNHNNNTFN
ncbi:protein-tyrosine-phosphatase [Entamoeba marina]